MRDEMPWRVQGMKSCLIAIFVITGVIIGSPVCALTIMVYEQSDRTIPVSEAVIYADEKYVGTTDIHGSLTLPHDGAPPAIRVARAGYREWKGIPHINDSLVLVPLETRNVRYTIQVHDADSKVPVSGALITSIGDETKTWQDITGSNGTSVISLRSEQIYNLSISANTYQDLHETLTTGTDDTMVRYSLKRDDGISLRVMDLDDRHPVPDTLITLNSVPAGRTDEKGVLVTSLSREVNHSVEVAALGYEPFTTLIHPGKSDGIVDLLVKKQKPSAFVAVYDPEKRPVQGVNVRIDNREYGLTNQYGILTIPALQSGTYSIMISGEGYVPVTRSMTIYPDNPGIILEISPQISTTVVQVVDTSLHVIEGASVSINGNSSFITDENGTVDILLETGNEYVLTAEKPGYLPNNSPVTPPVSGQVQMILKSESLPPVDLPLPILIITVCACVMIAVFFGYREISKKKNFRSRKKRIQLKKRSL